LTGWTVYSPFMDSYPARYTSRWLEIFGPPTPKVFYWFYANPTGGSGRKWGFQPQDPCRGLATGHSQCRADNGSHYATHDQSDPSVNWPWPMTHVTH